MSFKIEEASLPTCGIIDTTSHVPIKDIEGLQILSTLILIQKSGGGFQRITGLPNESNAFL